MIISEFGKPVTAKSLNESLAKRFGSRIKLENFTLEQLQDARNKIRTKLSQIEVSESFDTVIVDGAIYHLYMFKDNLEAASAAFTAFQQGIKDLQTLYINNYQYISDTRVKF